MTNHTAIPGLHHVTAISGNAQDNVDFFTGTLGQRLVKRTVNFDAPDTYHLYYGDRTGRPGTVMTFFPFADAAPGRAGPGMASAVAYAVPAARFDDLTTDLAARDVPFTPSVMRFGRQVVTLRAPDGLALELVESPEATDTHAFHSATLWVRDPDPTIRLLTEVMGYAVTGTERSGGEERTRLEAPGGSEARVLDVIRRDGVAQARSGAGTIHHIAFRARTQDEQHGWQERLAAAGHPTTPVIDRQYFNAIYFREPGGILFEIATDPPGFAVDEPVDRLGSSLMLPAQHEAARARIERVLPPLKVPA
ncbi:MAG TPA: ring-cleaving dioxygenase [Paracoccaceae bacterium]|nr:ring-cleaving dioxygenase [Paracoccaceae bacterium]